VYKNQQSRQTGSRNLTGPKTLPTIWHTYMYMKLVFNPAPFHRNAFPSNNSQMSCICLPGISILPIPPLFLRFSIKYWNFSAHVVFFSLYHKYIFIFLQASYTCRYAILWEAFLDPSDSGIRHLTGPKALPTILRTNMKIVTKYQISAINSC
jgi:hypothetical protein